MSQAIPENLRASQALKFVTEQGWNWQGDGSSGQIQIENCPFCKKGNFKFCMAVSDPKLSTRDGLYNCFHGTCAKTGNLRTLQEHLGVRIAGVDSRREWAGTGEAKPDALPDVEACHAALIGDAEAMDYLLNVRGFTKEIIDRQKLGLKEKVWFREAGESKALVIPYLVGGNIVFAKYRTLPPKPKDFVTPSGWEAPLYNGEILQEGLKDVIFVEGETNTISLMTYGVENVVGVPGANVKKAAWIETLDKIEPNKIFILYDNDKAGKKAAQEIASRIGIEKCWRIVLPPFDVTVPEDQCKLCDEHGITADRKYDEEGRIANPRLCEHRRAGKDINEWFRFGGGTLELFEKLKENAGLFDVTGVTSSLDALQQLEDELNGKVDLAPTYTFPWPELSRMIGMEDGDILDIVAPEKVGKFGAVHTPVLLPTGQWKKMGELKVGDEIASIDGVKNFVTGVFPQGKQELFRVTFWDNRSTLAGGPHLWKIHGCTPWERGNTRVYTTDAIANEYCFAGCRRSQKVYIDTVSGDFGYTMLPIAAGIQPWLLGALIGDGGITSGQPKFTSADKALVQKVAVEIEAMGDTLKFIENYDYRINGGNVKTHLECLGLWGCKSATKFIPKMYLEASKEDRWELLRGLMDTDGTVGNKQGTPSYCTVSKRLAEDMAYLVRSLGGIAKVSPPQKKHFKYKGELRTGQPAYIIVVRVPDPTQVFSLRRKLERTKARENQPRLTFKSIEPAGIEDAVCISVSHPSKLYITDDFIVTHNTTFGMNILDHMVNKYGEDGLLVCLEMTQARLAKKWVALVTGFEDTLTEAGSEESKKKLEELKSCVVKARAIQQSRGADLYFAYPQLVKEPEDVFKLIRDCIRRYGVKWVMFDNLQRLCDDTLKNQGHRTVQLSQISKGFAKLTKDYKIKLIRILQPKRIEKGATISTNDVDGSSQVAKDCDGMITLWRSVVGELKKSEWETQQAGFEECNVSFEPVMKVTVGLSRYSPGGSTKLFYDGARSQIRSLNNEQKTAMKPIPTLPSGSIPMEGGGSIAVVPTENLPPEPIPNESDIQI
jgi:replicative DNA helicase